CPRQESGRPPVRCCGRSYIGMTGQQGIRFGRAYPGGRVCPQLRKKYGKMNIRMKRTAGAAVLAAACWSCGAALPASLPERAEVPFEEVYPETGGVPVVIGGYGAAVGDDAADSWFWLLTDRGPNVDGPTPESKVFVLPAFAPRVGKFRLSGDSLVAVGTVLLRDAAGRPFCGLPPAGGDGSTGEVGYDLAGALVRDTLR